jgi:hypothetical protein
MNKKKIGFKAFLNIGVCALFAGYYMHLVEEKLTHNIDFVDSIEKDYHSLADPFLGILKNAEGVSKVFYADNKGYATGYGFNPTQNTPEYNREILKFAQVDEKTIEIIVLNANKYRNSGNKTIPPELKAIHFTNDQINKMALFAQKSYEQDFAVVLKEKIEGKGITGASEKKLLTSYKQLPRNKKGVLTHMVYKVGVNNLRKYNTFFTHFIDYLGNPTVENKEIVASSFIYHYKDNGKDLLDTRVSKIHHDEFMKDIKDEPELAKQDSVVKPVVSDKEKWDSASKEVSKELNKAKNDKYDREHPSAVERIYKTEQNETVDQTEDTPVLEEEDDEGTMVVYNSESNVEVVTNITTNGTTSTKKVVLKFKN